MKKSEMVLHDGPPPHIGWWNADFKGEGAKPLTCRAWRWWDGRAWSRVAFDYESSDEVAKLAACTLPFLIEEIVWSTYYPRNARVPRIDPRG